MSRKNAEHRAATGEESAAEPFATESAGRFSEAGSKAGSKVGSKVGSKARSSEVESRAESKATEDELVEAIRNADHDAFNRLYDRYFRRIYNFSFARLRNHADTEEVVQETFIAVFKSIEAYRGESLLVSWIYGIARNTVNNHLRKNKTQQQRLEQARLDLVRAPVSLAACSPEEHLGLQRCTDAIQKQLDAVGDWQAQVFVMRHIQNMSIAEIADETSRSSDSVRSSLYRVKRLLVEAVDPGSTRSSAPAQRVPEVTA